MRTVRGYLSATGFVACFYAFIDTFTTVGAATMRHLFVLAFSLYMLFLIMALIEYWMGSETERDTWRLTLRRASHHLRLSYKAFAAATIAQLVYFLVLGHGGQPEIRDDQCLSVSHGKIVLVLTEAQYRRLDVAFARVQALFFMMALFAMFLTWWVNRSPQPAQAELPGRG